MNMPSEVRPRRDPSLQIDSGQKGTFNQYRFDLVIAKVPYLLCYVLSAGDSTGTAPTLYGALMKPHTEYWLFDIDGWNSLVKNYGTTDLTIVITFEQEQSTFTRTDFNPTTFTAGTYALWKPIDSAPWPQGTLAFSAPSTATGDLRGLAFESTSTGSENAVWWATQADRNLEPADLDGMVLSSTATTKGALAYARSALVPSQT